MLLGQEKLCNKIQLLDKSTFPKTLLLLGEYGSGKHTLCNLIAEHLMLPLIDITDNLNFENILNYQCQVSPHMYLINISLITEKEENVILKFLEEPLQNSYIVCIAQNKNLILPTILSRCQIWNLQKYSFETMQQLYPDLTPQQYKLQNTPGKYITYKTEPIEAMLVLVTKLFDCIGRASLANTLTIVDKCYYKDKDKCSDKFNFNTLVDLLSFESVNRWATFNTSLAYMCCNITSDFCNKVRNTRNIDKKQAFEHYLITLRNFVRSIDNA